MAGYTYTVKVTARYDSNMAVAANDDPLTLLVNEAGDGAGIADDRDASVTTTIIVHVPTVAESTTFKLILQRWSMENLSLALVGTEITIP